MDLEKQIGYWSFILKMVIWNRMKRNETPNELILVDILLCLKSQSHGLFKVVKEMSITDGKK